MQRRLVIAATRRCLTTTRATASSTRALENDEPHTQNLKAKRRQLLLPPLLDPVVIEAKERHTSSKRPANTKEFAPFQHKLYQNAYAHALATPIRNCSVSSARLPSFFLLDLHVYNHPGTGDPWVAPLALITNPVSHRHIGTVPAQTLVSRMILRHSLLELCTTAPRIRNASIVVRFHRDHASRIKRLVWREGLADVALTVLRDAAVVELKSLLDNKKTRFVHPLPKGWSEIAELETPERVACILSLNQLDSPRLAESQAQMEALEENNNLLVSDIHVYGARTVHKGSRNLSSGDVKRLGQYVPYLRLSPEIACPPLWFRTFTCRGKQVSVYGLVELLGQERVDNLVSDYEMKRSDFTLKVHGTVKVQMALMRLSGYLARSGIQI
ncbi:hypothetical protein M501DRAFT_992480 [Patellaria atrata CBS 101060]|uniref:Uncharacterized protein n=1 Tax=Patellaria atrata CBS 101060 TaxID=1346257 RepID=A0A9P4S9C3_9PEZI|nr:hypothetical protein M501DRAFT_992480 [Patellaria atrata CBS 101060]